MRLTDATITIPPATDDLRRSREPTTPSRARPPLRVSFVIPGRGHAGGLRVTSAMATELLERGHIVRLLYRRSHCPALHPVEAARLWHSRLKSFLGTDWLRAFPGETHGFDDLNDLDYTPGEVVIAIGAFVVEEVHALRADVIKLRWCHGFSQHLAELMERAWSLPMPTLSVSPRLVPTLESISGEPVLAVVPNGIRDAEYYNEHRHRDGVGSVFSRNWKKAPEVATAAMKRIHDQDPSIRRYMFGAPSRPSGIPRGAYWRLPSIAAARELYNRSRVWIIPSRSEGFCLPILEAMACGAAVISTDHDTARGLIRDGHNGVLVPVDDPEALADAAVELYHDTSRRRELTREGFRTAAGMTWPSAADQLEDALYQLAPREMA